MPAEVKKEIQLEIAHVLFIDIVGYSKLSVNEQHAAVEELNQIVRATEQFQKAEAGSRLLKIPTGDGMALVFYTSPEAPAQCALEISRAAQENIRGCNFEWGFTADPVSGVVDVNERANLAGAGINMAQRVMDCGDAGHILVSRHVAEDLEEYEQWRPLLHDLGTCEVKHGVRVSVVKPLRRSSTAMRTLPQKFRDRAETPEAICVGQHDDSIARARGDCRWRRNSFLVIALTIDAGCAGKIDRGASV